MPSPSASRQQIAKQITTAILLATFPHSAKPGKQLFKLFYPVVRKELRTIRVGKA